MKNETTTWAVHRHTFCCTQGTVRNTSWTKHPAISVVGSGCCLQRSIYSEYAVLYLPAHRRADTGFYL